MQGSTGAERAPRRGRWRRVTPEPSEDVQRLEALGYAVGSTDGGVGGVWSAPNAMPWGAASFYTSGDHAGARLEGLDGTVLHTWTLSWPDATGESAKAYRGRPMAHTWRRALLLPDGDVLAIYEGLGIARVSRDSKPRWVVANGAHHDLQRRGDEVWLLTREVVELPDLGLDGPVLEEFLVALDLTTGKETYRTSLVRALHESPWGPVTKPTDPKHAGDLLHTNSLEWLPATAGASGVLLSLLARNELALFDPETRAFREVVSGDWARQHDPHWLGGGNVLLFDNQGAAPRSRVLTLNWPGGEILEQWSGPADTPFYSHTCGTASPLPGGHMLVTESDAGRAYERNRQGDVIWRWTSPWRAGSEAQWTATLFEMQRLERLPTWLPHQATDVSQPVSP